MVAVSLEQCKTILAEAMPQLRAQYNLTGLGVFGSRVRRSNRSDSDLDLLVSFSRPPGMLTFLKLEQELSDRLGLKVDLVMPDALDRRIAEKIVAEVEPI